MQVIVKSRHTTVPPTLKEMATRKAERVAKFLDRIQSLEIEFSEEHNPRIADKHIVELTLSAKEHVLRAHASGRDQASAVDAAVKKLEAQVKKLKEKQVERWHGGSPGHRVRKDADVRLDQGLQRNGSERPIQSEEVPEPGEEGGPRITRVKRFAIKPMTAEEAVLQMESLGHDFYLFVNAESDQAGVVYRRRDGSFGLIEPV